MSGAGFQKDHRAWRFFDDEFMTGASNMALDEALARSVGAGNRPVMRIYGFDPPCITVGRFQKVDGIDTRLTREMGIDVVRRPTGGLAILHVHDLTYSLALPVEGAGPSSKGSVFMTVARGILASLQALGIEASIANHPVRGPRSAWCFSGEFGVDIEWRGRKVCGSAQRMFEGAVLQHGSLFLDLDEDALFALAKDGDPPRRGTEHRLPLAALGEAAGRSISREEVAEAFRSGFGRTLGIELENGTTNEYEDRLYRHLMETRYSTGDWLISSASTETVCDIIRPTSHHGRRS